MGENGLRSWVRLQRVSDGLKRDVVSLEKKNLEYEEKLESLENDPAALEKFAREEFHMLTYGEEVLLVRPAETEKKN